MIKRCDIYAFLGLLLFSVSEISAQTYDVIEWRNFWNAGRNATGIRMDSVTLSYAELYGKYDRGGFRDSWQASESWSAGAVAKTITHMEKYSMAGSFSFDNTSGENMSGSMFIRPGYYPVDILEFTPGRKTIQTYAFAGGVSVDIALGWRIGAGIDFTSTNYAKRKDLRHTNYRLDMTVSPGVMHHWGNHAVGLSYVFGKNGETVKAEEIGTAATSYYAFLDKGLMYGAYEVWSGSGIHLSESGINGFPVKELSHGAAVQLQLGRFYGDIAYLYSSGSVGEKQTVWFEFPTHRISSLLGYRFRGGGNEHYLRLNIDWSHQVNDENVLGKETTNGITITHTYGSNRIFKRDGVSVNPEYELVSPRGELRFGAEISSTEYLATQMYPYVVSRSMIRNNVYMSGVLHMKRFDLKAGSSFASGNFIEKRRELQVGTEPGDPPHRLAEYYDLQNEYLTAPRITLDLAVRYRLQKELYAEVGAGFTHGFHLKYVGGTNRWYGMLKIGYTF